MGDTQGLKRRVTQDAEIMEVTIVLFSWRVAVGELGSFSGSMMVERHAASSAAMRDFRRTSSGKV
jgi:hypothetical protein